MKLTIKDCRIKVKATAKELAKYVGVTEDSVYNWESGKYAPKFNHTVKILDFFEEKGLSLHLNDLKFLP